MHKLERYTVFNLMIRQLSEGTEPVQKLNKVTVVGRTRKYHRTRRDSVRKGAKPIAFRWEKQTKQFFKSLK
jgi:hypothetical protein